MSLLDIQDLRVEFPTRGGGWFAAVDGLSLTLEPGERLALVGESGSGKSVAMLAVMGLLPRQTRITAGVMRFDGQDLQRLSPRERRRINGGQMAMIFQEPMSSLNPCFTIGFQLDEALRAHTDLDRRARRRAMLDLLASVGIGDAEARLRAFPHQLSGGMSQRVMIAMAIACRPRLLIADEPTTALDVTIQAQILDLLRRLQQETGMGLILITHDMGVVAEMAKRVSVQYAGWQVEQQPVAGLFRQPRHPYTAALLAALPERATGARLPAIPGVVPGPGAALAGCRFAPRCPQATPLCQERIPPRAGPDLGAALCHFPLGQPEMQMQMQEPRA